MAPHISALLSQLFQKASSQHYSTAEQETSRAWEASEKDIRNGSAIASAAQPKVDLRGEKPYMLDVVTQASIQEFLKSRGTHTLRHQEEVQTVSDQDRLMDREAKQFDCLEIGKANFKPFACDVGYQLSEARLQESQDNFVEWRDDKDVYTCNYKRRRVRVIERIIRHRTVLRNGEQPEERLFIQMRQLTEFHGDDLYGFSDLGAFLRPERTVSLINLLK
jgi:hypothetical protein